MLCDKCQQREAKILYTEIIGGVKKEQHLCEECAAQFTSFKLTKPDYSGELTLGDLLSSIFDAGLAEKRKETVPEAELKCGRCQTTYKDFLKDGRIGCADCYHYFGAVLSKTLKSIQGTDRHIGKKPEVDYTETNLLSKLEPIERLTLELHAAIESEAYEEAARLRDEIRALKGDVTNAREL